MSVVGAFKRTSHLAVNENYLEPVSLPTLERRQSQISQLNASHAKYSEMSDNNQIGGESSPTGIGPISKGANHLERIKEDSKEAEEEAENMIGNVQFQLYKLNERTNQEISYRELLRIAKDTTAKLLLSSSSGSDSPEND
jgi:hypothetical protein